MIWKKKNINGEEIVLYSGDEVLKILEDIRNNMGYCFMHCNSCNNCSGCSIEDCNGEFSYLENLVKQKIEELDK